MLPVGSSPLARGARGARGVAAAAAGIIPACAGSTFEYGAGTNSHQDHPRLRGEHSLDKVGDFLNEGSSPLARGALRSLRALNLADGIIPACAGSTCPPWRSSRRGGDHPRLRGEHLSK